MKRREDVDQFAKSLGIVGGCFDVPGAVGHGVRKFGRTLEEEEEEPY